MPNLGTPDCCGLPEYPELWKPGDLWKSAPPERPQLLPCSLTVGDGNATLQNTCFDCLARDPYNGTASSYNWWVGPTSSTFKNGCLGPTRDKAALPGTDELMGGPGGQHLQAAWGCQGCFACSAWCQ